MFDFFEQEPTNPVVEETVNKAREIADGKSLNPFIIEAFMDERLFFSFPDSIRQNPQLLSEYLVNCSGLQNILHRERVKDPEDRGLFGKVIRIPETTHASGQTRRSEEGQFINLEYLRQKGINPEKILLFRVTQPSDIPKPEYYWTTDFFETQKGLRAEISEADRMTSVTLVCDMATMAGEAGLIQDINDDNGLAVRQISTEPFDQKKALAVI